MGRHSQSDAGRTPAPGRLGLDLSGAVSLSGVLAPGSLVRVGGVEINIPMEVEEVAPGGVACADSRPGNAEHGARIVARLAEAGAAMLAHLP